MPAEQSRAHPSEVLAFVLYLVAVAAFVMSVRQPVAAPTCAARR